MPPARRSRPAPTSSCCRSSRSPATCADAERLRPHSEPLHGATFEAWRDVAAQAGGVVVGGFCEAAPAGLYNTAIEVGKDGLLLHYRKAHLFA